VSRPAKASRRRPVVLAGAVAHYVVGFALRLHALGVRQRVDAAKLRGFLQGEQGTTALCSPMGL
jgi:hypothetical protein